MSLIKRIQNTIFQHDLFKKGDSIIIAVSGGPDSVFMLDIFSLLQKKYDLELVIAHVNYNLRGTDSEKDEELVKKLAKEYALPIEILRPKITVKTNLENNLRDIRHAFFEEVRKKHAYNAIAVAHNLDDQVETFLMRIIRGAGMRGLRAMQYKNNFLIRPLLAISRKEILEYIKENRLQYRIDKTNRESVFFRNKIRNRLIPYLETNFNPGIKKTIAENIVSLSEDYALLNTIIDKKYQDFEKEFSVSKLLLLPQSLQKRILRLEIKKHVPQLKNIEAKNIEEILKIVKSTKNKNQVVLFKGLKATRKGDKLEISKNK